MRQRSETLFRRHSDTCKLHQGSTYEADELRKWTPCKCAIHYYGHLRPDDAKPTRRCTHCTTWEIAKATVERWKSGRPSLIPPAKPATSTPATMAIADACSAYVLAHERAGSAASTLKKCRLFSGMVAEFSAQLGRERMAEWTRADVSAYLDWRGGEPKTRLVNWSAIKAAFEWFVGEEIIPLNVARFKTIRNRESKAAAKGGQKFPYTDDELAQMLAVCENKYGKQPVEWSRGVHHEQNTKGEDYRLYRRTVTGKDLSDFILISVYTGLRISDVATFHLSRLAPNGDVRVRALKNGTWVSTWVPPWLAQLIRDRAKKHGDLIFGEHTTTDMDVITDVWRRKLKVMWKLCGGWEISPTAHRFRHTFVRILLQRRVPLAMVSELTGDTEQMIRRFYSGWVTERQDTVREVLQAAFADVPKGANVVPIHG
ncbi:MAG: tyrosine-type recombinase/integrase [Candidatus Solibacter sp.]